MRMLIFLLLLSNDGLTQTVVSRNGWQIKVHQLGVTLKYGYWSKKPGTCSSRPPILSRDSFANAFTNALLTDLKPQRRRSTDSVITLGGVFAFELYCDPVRSAWLGSNTGIDVSYSVKFVIGNSDTILLNRKTETGGNLFRNKHVLNPNNWYKKEQFSMLLHQLNSELRKALRRHHRKKAS